MRLGSTKQFVCTSKIDRDVSRVIWQTAVMQRVPPYGRMPIPGFYFYCAFGPALTPFVGMR